MDKHILLVEDEEGLRMALEDRLRRTGYAVDCAHDGETGFQKASSLPFDLMIVDVMLPGRSGVDLCRDMRLAGLATPVLMLSARCGTEDVVAGFRAGADAYVTKPFEMLELTTRIEALLRRAPTGRSQTSCEMPGSGAADRLGLREEAVLLQDEALDEFCRQLALKTDPLLMAKVTAELRKTLDRYLQNPDAKISPDVLNVAKAMTNFLEEMLARIRRSAF
jgi:DNA-binding response OmpR family regulator